MVKRLVLFIIILLTAVPALAQDQVNDAQILPEKRVWSFSGPFGTYDKAQLQRGLQVYREVCAACHSLKYVAFRDLSALGYTQEDIKNFAAQFEVLKGPDQDGEMTMKPALPSDYFPSPYTNDKQAELANNGAIPADLSLMARARAVPSPFPGFIGDMLTNYTTAGPDYIAALLTGYGEAPEGGTVAEGNYYNPYFASGNILAMMPPLSDGLVQYSDGTAMDVEHYAQDVAAFLMWTSDPHMETRKKTGLQVMIFLFLLAGLSYFVQRQIWRDVQGQDDE